MSVLDLIRPPGAEPWAEEALALLRALPDPSRAMILTMLRAAAAEAPPKAKPVLAKKKRGG